jgi:serine/threonine-protein kinase
VGQLLEGRFRIEAFLARGGMGEVYRGVDVPLQRDVAVKLLAEELCRDPLVVERFLREARATASLDHPNVIPVYAAGSWSGRPYLVMKFVQGETVADRIRRAGPIPVPEAVAIVSQVCDGLGVIHARGWVHRDIKPQNLMVLPDGRCLILDFGILRQQDSTLTATGVVAGTPAYIAPEQAREPKGADARSDLYALGVTFFEMLTGELPFKASSAFDLLLKHTQEPPPRPSARRPGLSRRLDELILRLLVKDPARRVQTASDLKAALAATELEETTPVPRRTAPPSPRTRPEPALSRTSEVRATGVAGERLAAREVRQRPKRVAWIAAGLAAVAVAAVLAWTLARPARDRAPPSRGAAPPAPQIAETPSEPEPAPAPAPAPRGRLVVNSIPADAVVRVDGTSVGRTPRELDLAPGTYRVELAKDGHKPGREEVRLEAGRSERVDLVLEPLPATLTVTTSGTWGLISIDNEVLGKTQSVTSRLPPGPHQVRVRRPGYVPVIQRVTLAPGEVKTIEIPMVKR